MNEFLIAIIGALLFILGSRGFYYAKLEHTWFWLVILLAGIAFFAAALYTFEPHR